MKSHKSILNEDSDELQADYDTYRKYLENNLRSILTSPLIFIRIFVNIPKLLKSPTIPLQAKLIFTASSLAGIYSIFSAIPEVASSEATLCINILVVPILGLVTAFGTFIFLSALPAIIKFILKLYPWKVSLIYFLWLYASYIFFLLTYGEGISIQSIKIIDLIKALLLLAAGIGIMAVPMGFMSAALSVRLTKKSFLGLLFTSVALATWIDFAFTSAISNSVNYSIVLNKEFLLESFLFISTIGTVIFWAGWMFLAVWRDTILPFISKHWSNKKQYAQQFAITSSEIVAQIEGMRISKTYLYALIMLSIYTISTFVTNRYPKQLGLLVELNFGVLGFLTASFIIVPTFQYLFIPKELSRVRIDALPFISRPVARALLILPLLFILWWVFHSDMMMNINNFSQIMDSSSAYRFLNGQSTSPAFGDYMFFTFALMTNSGYLELHPHVSFAKIHVMMVSITGLMLLVVFIAVALSQQDASSTKIEKGEIPNKNTK
ncbi:hypothetical protein ANAEL_03483 [Anaerolineales bacterium]|nr:hypothetical protein ANAEL_03483 [Anaerolineales bacterium]